MLLYQFVNYKYSQNQKVNGHFIGLPLLLALNCFSRATFSGLEMANI